MTNLNLRPLKLQQIKDWLDHPVTIKFLRDMEIMKQTNLADMNDLVLTKSIDEIKEELQIRKGQIYTLDLLLDMENFLLEEETEDGELQTNEIELNSEDNKGDDN